MLLGAHVSIAGSIDRSVDRAKELQCTTFQIFTRNPRGWRASKLKDDEVDAFKRKVYEARYEVVIAHMPYLPNISSPLKVGWTKSVNVLIDELERCELLGIQYLVCHIGSHMGRGVEVGIAQVSKAVDLAIERVSPRCMVLLENMAGQRNSTGSKFEDINKILSKIQHGDRVGVCLDTCHLLAAGYDVRTSEAIERTLSKFDEVVGLKRMKVVHLNDSKGKLGSSLDRHEHIGLGEIGEEGFRSFINNPMIRDLPMIIETPEDEIADYYDDLAVLRRLYKNH
ncbi:MAG: deoxyribonuclease IV [Aigarchaeota archaeon]|nr:deoxyribonuclease IV [Aigarchaeota archaeon]MDW8092393.1 deoxyribonuclease IV [Nitrososphaerota archaeon]